jgi:hypothetical protein
MNISNNLGIHQALENDEKDVSRLLWSVLCSTTLEKSVLELKGHEADCFMNLISVVRPSSHLFADLLNSYSFKIMDKRSFGDDEAFYRMAHRLLLKLSRTCDNIPSTLPIEGVRPPHYPNQSTSLNNPASVDMRFDQIGPLGVLACPRQSCITAQLALDHATAMEMNVNGALALCEIPGGAFFIQVGFNEDMILLGRGALQEIYIYVNFEIPGDASPVLNELGKALSPFPGMLLTPTTPHRIPVFSEEGTTLHETEFWGLVEDRGIFRRDLSMHDECVPHNMAAQDGELREGGGDNHPVDEVNRDAWAGVSRALVCSDNTGGGDMARKIESSGSGSGGSSGGGGAGFQGGDGRREEGSGGLTGGGGSTGGGGFPGGDGPPGDGGDGGDGGGDDSGSSSDGRDRGPHIGELSIPLSAILDVDWDQDPRISQRFSTTSKIDTMAWLVPFRADFY